MPSFYDVFTTDLTLTEFVAARPLGGYIADLVAPVLDQPIQTGKIMHIDPNGEINIAGDDVRAPGSEARPIGFNVSRPVTFDCQDHSLVHPEPIENFSSEVLFLQDQMNYASRIVERLKINKEVALINTLVANMTGAALTTVVGAADQFDAAGADPIGYLSQKLTDVEDRSGVRPTTISMGMKVQTAIANSAGYLDRVKYNQVPTVDAFINTLKSLLGIPNVFVAMNASKNTAIQGQTPSFSTIWGEYVLLSHQEPAQRETSNLVQTVVWSNPDNLNAIQGGIVGGYRIETNLDWKKKALEIRGSRYYDQKFLYAAADTLAPGHLLSDTLS